MSQRGLLQLGLLLLTILIGCSWFIDPLENQLRCSMDAGPDPCPRGLSCQEGRCEPPCVGYELCGDNLDNDCDGQFDEMNPLAKDVCGADGDGRDNDCDDRIDEGTDEDRDGFFPCPEPSRSQPLDCEDMVAEVWPGAPEVCDNLDNDCDPSTPADVALPNGAPLCSPGEKCEQGRCVKPTCADPGFACKQGTVCSATTGACEAVPLDCATIRCPEGQECKAGGVCQARPKQANGNPCLNDGDCASGTCVDAAALRLPGGLKVCGQACCDDRSCAPEESCFASGTGARSCLPKQMLPSGALRQCTTDTACGREQCALENDQRLTAPYLPTTEVTTSVCRAPDPALRQLGQLCNNSGACSSSTCVQGVYTLICSTPCGHSGQCARFADAAPFNGNNPAYCRYLPVHGPAVGRTADYASVCVLRRTGETGKKQWGDECNSSQECQERGCIGAVEGQPGQCLNTCCENKGCVTEAGTQTTCRPFKVGMGYEMRCLAPPKSPSAQPR